jgi:hypothetical protein
MNCFQRLLSIFLLSVFILSACQAKVKNQKTPDKVEGTSDSEPKSDSTSPIHGPLELKATPVGLENPHQYEVQLKWHVGSGEPSQFFIVQRSDWNEGRVVQGDQGFYRDTQVEEGKKYSYQVRQMNASQSSTTDFVQIQIPLDKVFEGGEHIEQGTLVDYQRIFLKNQAKVYWQGERLELIASELISEDATLESFSPDKKTAELGQKGRSGGELILRAKKLRGDLFIRGDGQQGGQGESGAVGATGSKGSRGPDTVLHEGAPTQVPKGAYIYRGYWFKCDPVRVPGGEGGRGGRGGAGFQGKKGGNSSKILIEVKDPTEGNIFISNKPGLGGDGGLGGLGGPGGEGGEPGSIEWQMHSSTIASGTDLSLFYQCQADHGATGPQGDPGNSGPRGTEGFQAPVCIKMGDSQQGLCN